MVTHVILHYGKNHKMYLRSWRAVDVWTEFLKGHRLFGAKKLDVKFAGAKCFVTVMPMG